VESEGRCLWRSDLRLQECSKRELEGDAVERREDDESR
jgi:hypothetical protein